MGKSPTMPTKHESPSLISYADVAKRVTRTVMLPRKHHDYDGHR